MIWYIPVSVRAQLSQSCTVRPLHSWCSGERTESNTGHVMALTRIQRYTCVHRSLTTSWYSCCMLVASSDRALASSLASACCSGGMVLPTRGSSGSETSFLIKQTRSKKHTHTYVSFSIFLSASFISLVYVWSLSITDRCLTKDKKTTTRPWFNINSHSTVSVCTHTHTHTQERTHHNGEMICTSDVWADYIMNIRWILTKLCWWSAMVSILCFLKCR